MEKAYFTIYLENSRVSTAVLIANFPKNGINGCIGANTLGVPVYFLFPMGAQGCQLEAESIACGVWNGRFSL